MKTTGPSLRTPADEYVGPPKEWFFGDEWHARDLAAVFRPGWLVAGHVDELAARGRHGYLTFSLGAEEAFVRRDENGRLRAYHNVCPHRGSRLCHPTGGAAMTKRVVCPYHLWTFSVTDGALINAREMHDDFDPSYYGLTPVHVTEWKGIIFVCFAEDAPPPIDVHLQEATFGSYAFDKMKLAATKSHEVRANWKIVVENNGECYHCAVNHPELVEVYDWRDMASDDFDGDCARRAAGEEVWNFSSRSAHTVKGRTVCAVPAPRRPDARDGDPLETHYVGWEPGVVMNFARDMGWMFVCKPLGPDRTEVRQFWFVADEAQEGRDYDVEELKAFWDVTMQQDREICEWVQHGMSNPVYRPGPLNRIHQAGQAAFYAWYTARITARFPEVAEQGAGA